MNPRNLSIATACALCVGCSAILMKFSLSTIFFALGSGMLFLLALKRTCQGWTSAGDSLTSNETLFEQEAVGVISTVMAATGIGLTYILVNHVLDFQLSGFDCSSTDPFREESLVLECSKRIGMTTAKFWIFFSLIAVMWSLARRYMVRERWDDL